MDTKTNGVLGKCRAGIQCVWRWLCARPGQSVLWALFFLTPLIAFLEVELLSENNPFLSLEFWQWGMNLLWYACILTFAWLITGRRKGSITITMLLSFVIGIANHYILEFRGRALFPIDLLSLRTAANVAGNYDYSPDLFVWTALAVLVLMLVPLAFLPKEPSRFAGKRWIKRTCIGLCAGWVVYILVFFFSGLLPACGVYAQQWRTKGNGFLLNFTVSARYMRVEKPDGYSEKKVQELIDQLEPSDDLANEDEAVTNFLIVMNESYADLLSYDSLTLSGDPTPYLHSLRENTIRGNMISPVTGGGTASVEFEVLTGNTTAFLPSGTVAYQMYLRDGTSSLAQTASSMEMRTSAYHPYLSSGWNRTSAYPWMGFDKQYYLDNSTGSDMNTQYDDTELVREYVSDRADYQRLYQLTDAAHAAGQRCFVHNVTMQNHSGYNKAWGSLKRGVTLQGNFVGKGYDNTTNQYLALMQESDEALRELIEHYSQVDERTVILFFGDHQPPLNNKLFEDIYGKELDERTDQELIQQYKTPFFIWANFDIPEAEDLTVGASFLGALASQVAGYPQTGYMKFVSRVNEEFQAITPVGFVLKDGTVVRNEKDLSPEQQELAQAYHWLEYANLFGDDVARDFFFVGEEP